MHLSQPLHNHRPDWPVWRRVVFVFSLSSIVASLHLSGAARGSAPLNWWVTAVVLLAGWAAWQHREWQQLLARAVLFLCVELGGFFFWTSMEWLRRGHDLACEVQVWAAGFTISAASALLMMRRDRRGRRGEDLAAARLRFCIKSAQVIALAHLSALVFLGLMMLYRLVPLGVLFTDFSSQDGVFLLITMAMGGIAYGLYHRRRWSVALGVIVNGGMLLWLCAPFVSVSRASALADLLVISSPLLLHLLVLTPLALHLIQRRSAPRG